MSAPAQPETWVAGIEAAALFARLHALSFPEPWSEPDFARLLASSGVAGLGVRQHDSPAGLALIRTIAGECEILTIGIHPDRRRSGIGRILLEAAHDQARRQGARRMFLEVSERNKAAQALYATAGYRQVGERKSYYRDGSTARVLARDLIV